PVAALRRPGREFSPGVWRTHHPGTTRPDVDNGYHFYIWWDTFRRPDRPRGSPPVPAPSPTAPPRSPTRSPTRPRRRRAPVLPLLAAGTLLTFVVSLGVGPVGMAPAETLAVL